MKNLFASALLLLTLSFSSVSFASSKPAATPAPRAQNALFAPVEFIKLPGSQLDALVKERNARKLTIRVLDAQGNTLVTKTIGKNKAGVRFNLASLADGSYQIKVTDGKHTQVQEFNLASAVPVPAKRSLSLA